jgi:hypothetical protein
VKNNRDGVGTMIIRKEQTEVFRQHMVKNFEDRMVAHLTAAFPQKCKEMGDAKVREEIRSGIARAAGYNIEAERDVARFIDLTFLIGRDFDTSPATPWAQPILRDKSSSADNRLRRVQLMARRHMQAAGGRIS